MDIVTFLIVCVIVGIVLSLIIKFVPMEPNVRNLMVYGTVAILALWLILGLLGMAHVGTVRIN